MTRYSLDDQVAFYEDADEVRDATLRILDKFESVAIRPQEPRLGQRSQRRTYEERL